MLPLIYFMAGIITFSIILPTIDSLVSVIQQWAELKKAAMAIKQAEIMEDLQGEEEKPSVVGFQWDDSTPEEEEEEGID